MAYYKGEDGSLIIEPEGDILFADAECPSGNGNHELVICAPGGLRPIGALAPEFEGASTGEINTLVRVKLNLKTCAVLMERLALTQIALHGFEPLTARRDDAA